MVRPAPSTVPFAIFRLQNDTGSALFYAYEGEAPSELPAAAAAACGEAPSSRAGGRPLHIIFEGFQPIEVRPPYRDRYRLWPVAHAGAAAPPIIYVLASSSVGNTSLTLRSPFVLENSSPAAVSVVLTKKPAYDDCACVRDGRGVDARGVERDGAKFQIVLHMKLVCHFDFGEIRERIWRQSICSYTTRTFRPPKFIISYRTVFVFSSFRCGLRDTDEKKVSPFSVKPDGRSGERRPQFTARRRWHVTPTSFRRAGRNAMRACEPRR